MSELTYLLFYIPLCVVVLTVLEMCRESRPKQIAARVTKNFLLLTGLFVGGSLVVLLLQIFLPRIIG